MSTPPEHDPLDPPELPAPHDAALEAADTAIVPSTQAEENSFPAPSIPFASGEWVGKQEPNGEPFYPGAAVQLQQDQAEPPLFQSWSEPPIIPRTRIPNFGDVGILSALILVATVASLLLVWSALHFHLFGVTNVTQAATEIHYSLGSEVAIYLFTLLACLVVFPVLWHKGLFAGLQWNAATALTLRRPLFGAAFVCFILAIVNGWLMPGPENAPIDKVFRAPGAAWLLFAFGVTVAPFFEEIAFRGFLLPAFCTAWDWSIERSTHTPAPPLGEHDHPQWSTFAMIVGSILTSVPFALMHGDQTGWSLGPFLLLVCVSLVLCWARLSTRSLAASVLVHASYNFLLFSLMLIGTSGFKHLDKM
ncbi:MAG: CPBP family intramembrane glutamic endopeptidase [Terracidiphilus sp.]|jgi:membrane protease YdiL (CAAX protease family)